MTDAVKKYIRDSIETLENDWARNHVAFLWHSDHDPDSPNAKKERDAAMFNNKFIEDKIEWLQGLLDDEEAIEAAGE